MFFSKTTSSYLLGVSVLLRLGECNRVLYDLGADKSLDICSLKVNLMVDLCVLLEQLNQQCRQYNSEIGTPLRFDKMESNDCLLVATETKVVIMSPHIWF